MAEKITGPIVKRSVTLHGHRTSFSVEQPFFDEIVAAARANGSSLAALVSEIDETRPREVKPVISPEALRARAAEGGA